MDDVRILSGRVPARIPASVPAPRSAAAGTAAGTLGRNRPGMADPWPLHLTVDAHGEEDSWVRVRRTSADTAAYLSVRVGSVLVYCLDGAAVTAIASAWARAYAAAADRLPLDSAKPRPLAHRTGYAAPVAQVVAEGPQRWDVTAPRPTHRYAEVSSSWLTVRVHDATALRTYTRAWAQAGDLGQVLRRPPVPFARLLEAAAAAEMDHRYRDDRPTLGR